MMSSSPLLPPTPPSARRFAVPFLETDPLFDVRWGVLLLPLWWGLGVEQFVWPVIFLGVVVKLLYMQHLHVVVVRPLRWFALLLAAVLISALFITEPVRWLTYFRNLGAFTAGFLVLLIVTNRARNWPAIERLLDVALLAVIVAGGVGFLAAAGLWRPDFQSLAGRVLPEAITQTSYGRAIALRTVGQWSWFAGLGLYYRLNSFFLFSNHFSSVLVYAIPFLFYKIGRVRGWRRALVILGILLLIIDLIYTTGRVALLSLLAGAAYFALFHAPRRRAIQILSAIALAIALWLAALSAAGEFISASERPGVVGGVVDAFEGFVFARGSGSYTSRFGVYQATIEGFLQRPLFGWGTERDVEGLDLPAGSHSEYFAALYRQGLLGLVALLGLLGSVWWATRPPREPAALPQVTFLRYGRWFFVTTLINSVLNDPGVDTTTYVLLWLFIALLVATAQLIDRQSHDRFTRTD